MKNYKLIFTVPQADADIVRDALAAEWAGKVGNYSHCSFSSVWIGRFLPLDWANPAIGQVGTPEQVIEERVEMEVPRDYIHRVVAKLKEVHPYEEVTYDVIDRLDF